jgi:hypothetical protein
MREHVKVELNQKQKAKESFSLRLFGAVKSVHVKIQNSRSAIDFPACRATGTLQAYETKVEQEVEAAMFLLRRQLAIL